MLKQKIQQSPSLRNSHSYNGDLQFRIERELIVMMLGDEKKLKLNHILEHTCEGMFVHKSFKEIYNVIRFLNEQNKEINLYEIMAYTELNNSELEELYKEYITSINCDYYIEKLQESYINRLAENAETLEELQYIEEEKNKYSLKEEIIDVKNCSDELLTKYNTYENEIVIDYPSIADCIRVLTAGDVMVLAGGTSMGKTQFSLNLINRLQSKYKISIYSLEMTRQQLLNRIIAMNTGLDSSKIREHRLSPKEYMKYKNYIETELPKMNIKICDKKDVTTNYIKSAEMNSDSDLIVIDYLGLMTPNVRCKKYEAITELSRSVKILAGVVNKPILLLHQINREYMNRQDHRPLLSDLRDSGAIEQDADFVCFVHRPYMVGDATVDDHIEFIVRKNRFGKNNIITSMIYNGATQKITDKKEIYDEEDF